MEIETEKRGRERDKGGKLKDWQGNREEVRRGNKGKRRNIEKKEVIAFNPSVLSKLISFSCYRHFWVGHEIGNKEKIFDVGMKRSFKWTLNGGFLYTF